jgi:transcriptional regulator with XRE-family HTH domain
MRMDNGIFSKPSRLFSQTPHGLNTALVESLESYATRLALKHRVPRHRIDLLVNTGQSRVQRPYRVSAGYSLDCPTAYAKNYASELANLTGRPEVRTLGLGLFTNLISTQCARRQFRAWCDGCLRDFQASGIEPHWPLLWTLQPYVICHLHDISLLDRCSHCRSQISIKKMWKQPLDICLNCNEKLIPCSLSSNEPSIPNDAERVDADRFHAMASRLLSELVSMPQRRDAELLKLNSDWSFILLKMQDAQIVRTEADLAKLAGIAKATLHGIVKRQYIPSVQVLVRIAVSSNISIAGLLCADLWQENISSNHFDGFNRVPFRSIRNSRPKNWDQIRDAVRGSIEVGKASTPQSLARNYKTCKKLLLTQLGDLAPQLHNALIVQRSQDRKLNDERIKREFVAASKSLVLCGVRPTQRKVSEFMKISRTNPALRQAWAERLER